jgi:hypothetical protein
MLLRGSLAMDSESCHVSTSYLKEGVLGLRVPLGDDMFGLFDGSPDVVLCGSESDVKAMISTK